MVRGRNRIMSCICVLILDHILNEVSFYIAVIKFFRRMTSASLARPTVDMIFGCSIVFFDGIRVNPITIIFVVDT